MRHPALRVRVAVWLLALTALGLGLRLALLQRAGWRYDYDEGMVGLQALRILRGSRPVFHPGQPYLAALESYGIAGLFAVARPSAVTLKIIPWLLAGAHVAATGWLGTRAFGQRVGILSALLAACAPTYLLVTGMKTWGATAETLLLGQGALIAANLALDPRTRPRTQIRAAVALGLILGVAFWVSWLIAMFALPLAVGFARWGRPMLRRAWWAVLAAFVLGSAPLWIYNVQHDGATVRYLLSDHTSLAGGFVPVVRHLNNDLAPRLVSGDPRWHLLSWPAIWWLQNVYGAGLGALIVLALRGSGSSRRPARVLVALTGLSVPLVYLLSGWGTQALNEFGFDVTGRYVLMIHAVLPIGVAALAGTIARGGWSRRALGAALVTSVVALNLLGAVRADPPQIFASPYYARQPRTLVPLIAYLDARGIRHAWMDVGIAHVLMFETQERILAADWYDLYAAKGIVRFPEVPRAITAADRVAFVEVILPGQQNTRIELAFRAAGVPYTAARPSPDLLVIVPDQKIDPALVADGLGYQF